MSDRIGFVLFSLLLLLLVVVVGFRHFASRLFVVAVFQKKDLDWLLELQCPFNNRKLWTLPVTCLLSSVRVACWKFSITITLIHCRMAVNRNKTSPPPLSAELSH